MPEVIRFAKGTASEHLNFTGENGEITLICDDTPNRKVTGVIRLHDGQTVGGIPFGGSQLLNDMHDVNAANTIEFQVMTVDANGQFYFANTVETIADGTISGDKIYGGTISTSAAVFEGSSENAIVRITQTGTGNALVVEDSSNPDSTPFVIDASGKVGIGTSSPAANLDIKGSQLGGTAGDSEDVFRIHNPDVNNNTTYRFHNYRYTNGTSHSSSELRLQRKVDVTEQGYVGLRDLAVTFGYGTTERMRIDSSGNVGVGTNSPTNNTILHIKDTNTQIKLESTTGSNDGFINFDGTNLQLSTNRNMIDGVFSNTEKSNATIILAGTSGGSDIRMYTASGNNTVATERMRIDSSGNLLVGTTIPDGRITSRAKPGLSPFLTAGTWATSAAIGVSGSFGGGISWIDGNAGYCAWVDDNGNDFNIAGGGTGAVVAGGVYINNYAGSWSSRSDERDKINLEPITDAANKIKSLRTVIGEYSWAEGVRHPFLIAQDVQKVLPEAVSIANKSAPEEEQCLGMSYTDIVPLLTAALQESIALIESQQSQIDTLTVKTQEQDFTIASLISRIETLESNTTP